MCAMTRPAEEIASDAVATIVDQPVLAQPTRFDTAEFVQDPHAIFAGLRESAPVVPVVIAGDIHAWHITRYAIARKALSDRRLAKGAEHWRALGAGEVPFTGDVAVAARRNILSSDPPDHTRLRRVLGSAFTPHRVEALGGWIGDIVDTLIGTFAGRGTADLVAEFALPIPMTVICELFAVPDEHRAHIRQWTETLFHGATPEQMRQASGEIDNLLTEIVNQRRGELGEDFTSALIRAEDAREISVEELVSLMRAMLAGGNETTINLIGNSISALLQHPDQLALLRADPNRWPDAIEEVLRWDGPIQNSIWRFATEDIVIEGVVIPKGDAVIVGLASAGRDELAFEAPERFDILRPQRGHLAFGRGIHHCIGSPLARLEATIAVPALFARLDGLRLAVPPEELRYRRSTMSRGLIALPAEFTPG